MEGLPGWQLGRTQETATQNLRQLGSFMSEHRYLQATGKNPKTNAFTEDRHKKGLARLRECLKTNHSDSDYVASAD